MKLLNREPTEEMLRAAGSTWSEITVHTFSDLFKCMYDAAPEIKVDMEPYKWIVFKDQGGLFLSNVDNENDAKYWRSHGCFVKRVYSAEQLLTTEENWNRLRASWIETNAALQAENERLTAERDELQRFIDNCMDLPQGENHEL